LQHDSQLKIIAGNLEKKIKNELVKLCGDDRPGYEQFWNNFGRQLKMGILENYGQKKDELQDLLLFYSSTEKKLVTLGEYVSRMPAEQKYIYYVTGESIAAADQLPQTELLKEHRYEMLYMTDQADPFVVEMLRTYQEKEFRSAADDDLGLEDAAKPETAESDQETFTFIKEALGDEVDEVRASAKLKSHPVCLSSGEGMTFEMEKYFQAVQPEMKMKAKRILEVNTTHPIYVTLSTLRVTDPEKAKKLASVLLHQAQLIAGLPVEDASEYTDLLCTLLQ
jgi:molecular chaperone HtpG